MSKKLILLFFISFAAQIVLLAEYSRASLTPAASCEELLASEDKLSEKTPAEAYARLIEYYLEQNTSSGADAQIVLGLIARAQAPINPFLTKKDPLAIQVGGAVKKALRRFDESDWREAKKLLRAYAKKVKSEGHVRREKTILTTAVIKPRLVDEIKIGGLGLSAPASIKFDGVTYVAIGSKSNAIYLFEYKNEKLIRLDEKMTLNHVSAAPTWQVVDGKLFLASTCNDGRLYLLEILNKKFKNRGFINIGHSIVASARWHQADGRTFIAFGSINKIITLIELVDGEPIDRQTLLADGAIEQDLTWHKSGYRDYLVGVNSKSLNLYELVNGQLVERQKIGKSELYGHTSWFKQGDQEKLAAATSEGFKIYKFENSALVEEASLRIGNVSVGPEIHNIAGKKLLSVATRNKFFLYELSGDSLTERAKLEFQSNIYASPTWAEFDGRHVMGLGTFGDGTLLFEYVNDQLIEKARLKTKEMNLGSPAWLSDRDNLYFALSGLPESIFLFRLLGRGNF